MRRLTRRLAILLLVAGCARMGNPPGGPPDFQPPHLLATYPESTTVLPGFKDWVEFKFDETVSEGSQPNFGLGTGDLEKLVLLSPSKPGEVPRVEWHRSRITVRPRNGWKPNTVYRIELTPGVRDLSDGGRNIVKASHVITFATGGPLPTRALTGRAVDWAGQRFVPNALIEAMLLPDSLVYRSVTDSAGRFTIGPLPEGEFLVTVIEDQNHNARRDAKEAWDSVRVTAAVSEVGEIWAFVRDTMPPKASDAVRSDSVNITLTFTVPIDPEMTIPADSIRVLLIPEPNSGITDSASLGPISALPRAAHDSAYRARDEAARAMAAAAKVGSADTNKPAPPVGAAPVAVPPAARPVGRGRATDTLPKDEPKQPRPTLGSQVVVRTRGATQPGRAYWIELHGVRTAGGVTGDVKIKLTVPKPPVAKPGADSLKSGADSTRRRAVDSLSTSRRDSLPAGRRP
ncbi:MAG: Ig-like domain-containing protein [Gemmatimonadota bacterium]